MTHEDPNHAHDAGTATTQARARTKAGGRMTSSLKDDFLAQGMELRETHISWVFLGADTVYKVKKPVALSFLDFTTLQARKHFCEQELTLNQRLAPDVYRSVVPITRDADGRHRIGGSGDVIEWAVEMRRLPDRDNALVRLRDGRLDRQAVERMAQSIAKFHAAARADADTARYGQVSEIERNVRDNFEQTRDSAQQFLSAHELAEIERWQLAFIREHRTELEARLAQGRIRDGHGDLRLEHCYLTDNEAVAIIDCIEFSDRYRYGDVCADVAFLAMDLLWNERPDLSEALLAAYARAADDYDLYAVVDFYESYRAYVRGKVSSILHDDPSIGADARAAAAAQARKYYVLAEACAHEPVDERVMYVVGGMIASGKSTVADALAAIVHAPVIDADRTRKNLAGVALQQPLHDAPFEGHYSARATAETYAELLRRAAVVLGSKRSVVLDASFRDRQQRAAVLALAKRFDARLVFVECYVRREVCEQRLAQRTRGPSISDGRPAVLDAFVGSFHPIDELPSENHVRVDTEMPINTTLAAIQTKLLKKR